MARLKDIINDLLDTMSIEKPSQNWQAKAKILCDFAENAASETLKRANLTLETGINQDPWHSNLFAFFREGFLPGAAPSESYGSLVLADISPTFSQAKPSQPAYLIVFLPGSIQIYKPPETLLRTTTYDDAARFVVFWIEEKLLQILQANEWDKISDLVDLYDRMSHCLNEASLEMEVVFKVETLLNRYIMGRKRHSIHISESNNDQEFHQTMHDIYALLQKIKKIDAIIGPWY